MKKIFLSILILLFIFTINFQVKADTNYYVIPGGESIGLKINTGVEVVGKYTVQTEDGKCNPWKDSKINVGDYIKAVNNVTISTGIDLTNYLQKNNEKEITLVVNRDNEEFKTTINVVETNNHERTIGLYVKDKILGIGTLSFVYENKFASLGHGIYDDNELMSSYNGDLTWSTVAGIKKATINSAGEKRATLNATNIGKINQIKETGVYGTLNSSLRKNKIQVASTTEVTTGKAVMYTVIKNNNVEVFDVEIIETMSQSTIDSKGIKIKVTDSELLDATGGIIQGMSGSPIIQNGKLVGVVSHVTLENPQIGYAIYAEWMLNELLEA